MDHSTKPGRAGVWWLASAAIAFCSAVLAGPAATTPKSGAAVATKVCRALRDGSSACLARQAMGAGAGSRLALDLVTRTVLPNVKANLQAWVEYNPVTCALISSGAWTVTTPPTLGTPSFGILNSTLGNGDCPGIIFPFALLSYTWTSDDETATQDVFDARWISPDFVQADHFVLNLATVTVGAVDLAAGSAAVTLNGPTTATGTLTLEFSGPGGASATQTTTPSYPTGAASLTLDRPSIAKGNYDTLKVKWNASTPPVAGKFVRGDPWNVLGTVRYTQYNTPAESACTGGTSSVYIVDNLEACNFTAVDLKTSFVTQIAINGTGSSDTYGILKTGGATRMSRACRSHFPADATLANTMLQVASVTGSCNTVLVAGTSVATSDTSALACRTTLGLVRASNVNFGSKTKADRCPACEGEFGGTDGHIDSYTASVACSGHAVGDLGNFWTVKTP